MNTPAPIHFVEWEPGLPTVTRLKSRKLRHLLEATGQTPEQIVRVYAPRSLTYQQVADEWQRLVIERFPDFDLRFTPKDVTLIFQRYGVESERLTPAPLEVPA